MVVFICKCYSYYVVSALQPGKSMKVAEKAQHIVFSRQCEKNVIVYSQQSQKRQPSMLCLECFGSAGSIHPLLQTCVSRDLCWRIASELESWASCPDLLGKDRSLLLFWFILCIKITCLTVKSKLCGESIYPAYTLICSEVRTGSETPLKTLLCCLSTVKEGF